MRYLSMARPAFWLHTIRWTQTVLTQLVTIWLLVVEPVAYNNRPPLSMLWIPFLLGWAQGLRYLGIIRTDERIRSRFLTWADDATGDHYGLDLVPLAAPARNPHLRQDRVGHAPERRRGLPGRGPVRAASRGRTRRAFARHVRHVRHRKDCWDEDSAAQTQQLNLPLDRGHLETGT
ncbi:hypothetical protein ACFC4G_47735 [Streptomyces sp. NPDC056002]|uniref:hypothetical protein n=1 Tax=Streptomyces sp. NPDC056002 TaxID=3345675 RepID=UPI0035E3AB1C